MKEHHKHTHKTNVIMEFTQIMAYVFESTSKQWDHSYIMLKC